MKDSNSITRIIIADDHALFADGLEQILRATIGYEVVGKVSNGKSLLHLLNSTAVDLVLTDINMPEIDGLQAAIEIKKRFPKVKTVLISMYFNDKILETVKDHKLDGFIVKDTTAPVLKNALQRIIEGSIQFVLPEITAAKKSVFDDSGFLEKFKLSPREIEIIKLIKEGNSNREIAVKTFLSQYTVETHRKNIYRKLNLQGTAELVQFANTNNI